MSDNTPNYPHFSTSIYMPSGIRVFFTVPIEDWTTAFEGAQEFTDMLLAKGALLREPGLEAGEEKELIVTVMRREKPSDGTPIVDMYPNWGAGDFGKYKYLRVYLNSPKNPGDPDMVQDFLSASGFKSLEDIPLYDAQQALTRIVGKRHPKETKVPKPFFVVRHKPGKDKANDDGTVIEASWELQRYELPTSTAQNAPKQAPAQPQVATQPTAPQENAVRTFNTLAVTMLKQQNGKPYYSIQTVEQVDVLTFSRNLFRALGFIDETIDKWANTVPFQDHVINARLMERKDKTGTYYAAIIPEITF